MREEACCCDSSKGSHLVKALQPTTSEAENVLPKVIFFRGEKYKALPLLHLFLFCINVGLFSEQIKGGKVMLPNALQNPCYCLECKQK